MLEYFHIFVLLYSICSNQFYWSSANPLIGKFVEEAKFEDFSFVVSIGRIKNVVNKNNHFCTGSLISLQHVLTSEHCMRDEKPSNIRIKVGSNDLRKSVKYNVSSVITYWDWALKNHAVSLRDNDIAILKLSEKVIEPGVKPAAITKTVKDSCFYGKTAVTAGWGRMSCNRKPKLLQAAFVKILTPKQCSDNIYLAVETRINSFEGLLCTKNNPYVVLGNGDSGGPLLMNGIIIGINESNFPGYEDFYFDEQNFHTSITYYTEFIQDVLANH